MIALNKSIITTLFSISALAVLPTEPANACAGSHLEQYQVGSSLNRIISEMSGACPSSIILHAGMNGFVVCENSRFSGKKALLIQNGKVAAIRTGPNSYGNACSWQ